MKDRSYLLYTSLCTGEQNATQKQKLRPKGPKGPRLSSGMSLTPNFDYGKLSTTFDRGAWDPRGGRAQRRGDDGSPAREGVRWAERLATQRRRPRRGGKPRLKNGNFKNGGGWLATGPGTRGRGPLSGAATTDCQVDQTRSTIGVRPIPAL